jgi:RNA polymerase sigma-70 factor (ECF subfamily)
MSTLRILLGNLLIRQASNMVAGSEAPPEAATAEAIAFDEQALLSRCRDGQNEAFADLVRKYQDRIYNLIFRMTGVAEDAEELAQEVFLKAFENIRTFRGGSRFYTWLFRIAKNVAISHGRRKEAQTADLAAQREADPPAAAQAGETAQRVAAALSELDEEFRVVAILRDFEDMDYHDIAEVLELPVGTVKSRLHRARLMLRDKLADLVS